MRHINWSLLTRIWVIIRHHESSSEQFALLPHWPAGALSHSEKHTFTPLTRLLWLKVKEECDQLLGCSKFQAGGPDGLRVLTAFPLNSQFWRLGEQVNVNRQNRQRLGEVPNSVIPVYSRFQGRRQLSGPTGCGNESFVMERVTDPFVFLYTVYIQYIHIYIYMYYVQRYCWWSVLIFPLFDLVQHRIHEGIHVQAQFADIALVSHGPWSDSGEGGPPCFLKPMKTVAGLSSRDGGISLQSDMVGSAWRMTLIEKLW